MKIVRFSQNGHAPRLGCYLGQDRIADLEASATAFLASKGVVRAATIAAVSPAWGVPGPASRLR